MKTYFVADAHLGSRLYADSEAENHRFVNWLDFAARDADAIYLLGDIFDFWFEFAHSVPKGFDSVLEAFRRITASGTPIHFIPGNHDQWTYGYLSGCGLTIHPTKCEVEIDGKRFLLAHGHGLGEKRRMTKLINRVFESRACQFMFRHLMPPRLGLAFGYRWSARNRIRHDREAEAASENRHIDYYAAHTTDSEAFQVEWGKTYTARHPQTDYIVMGHLHRETNLMLPSDTQLIILDAFYTSHAYAVFDGEYMALENY